MGSKIGFPHAGDIVPHIVLGARAKVVQPAVQAPASLQIAEHAQVIFQNMPLPLWVGNMICIGIVEDHVKEVFP